MTEATEQNRVVRNPDENRYEVWSGGEPAGFAEYTQRGTETVFTHTEIDPAYGGRGLGGILAEYAIRDTIAREYRIVPECSFIQGYLAKHPEYAAHVVEAAGE